MRRSSRTGSFGLLADERLARLAAAGHERAFTVVYQRYHQALYRYCRSILQNDADAQDALQSAFAAAFAALARGQRDAPIRPWLFRIAHNEAVSALRRRRPTAELSAAWDACATSTEDRVAERAELSSLLGDLRRLTERQRSALVMRELSGLSHQEIAIALGTSVGAAKQTIYEARRSLFEFAEGRDMPCDQIRRTLSDEDGRARRSRRVRAHLRECSACAAFVAAIPARRADLRAVAPALPTAAAAGLLERVVGAGSAHGAGNSFAGLASATAGKTASAALTAHALAGVAVVASATVGVTIGVGRLVQDTARARSAHAVAAAVAPARPRSPLVLGRPVRLHGGARTAIGHAGPRPVAGRSTTSTGVHRSASARAGSQATSAAFTGTGVRHGAGSAPIAVRAGKAEPPPGQAKRAAGGAKTRPGQAKRANGRDKSPLGHPNKADGKDEAPPGHARTPPGQAQTPQGQAKASSTPAGATAPPRQASVAPSKSASNKP
jgi:RNA polymerase sigma factor (sigma-70 family)